MKGDSRVFKIPSKVSILLSCVLCVLLFIGCIVAAVLLPFGVELLANERNGFLINGIITEGQRTGVMLFGYIGVAAIALAVGMLFALLIRVKGGKVFTDKSIALIRGVSWACYLLAIAFIGIGFTYNVSFVAAFLAVFLGLCLRVVKNVLEEACRIKDENDLTV